jgi:cyclase
MGRVRIIPSLLLRDTGLVKTKKFEHPIYIGDPRNAVKIFNDKEVDELILLDIQATAQGKEPNYSLIEEIVSEAFMPIGYGGGINNITQVEKLFRLGVEKMIINNAAVVNPQLITQIAERYGSQAVVISIDVKKKFFGKNKIFTKNGKENTNFDPVDFAKKVETLGAGEIYLTSIDKEGTMLGYDFDLLEKVAHAVNIPIVANGGAGTILDFKQAIDRGCSAVSAGSMFVFHGKLRGILINYPSITEIKTYIS